ncbi:uncharacterized protein LOC123225178 [Mangifera indica]|uniref:uncharacterized protein LOC123225178 n=1 Tax=Mangifera indica TaxID=29780 RepID=UPI001CFA6A08|nr:uncharacterized protein LOC123225178 [Mangifera indica]
MEQIFRSKMGRIKCISNKKRPYERLSNLSSTAPSSSSPRTSDTTSPSPPRSALKTSKNALKPKRKQQEHKSRPTAVKRTPRASRASSGPLLLFPRTLQFSDIDQMSRDNVCIFIQFHHMSLS